MSDAGLIPVSDPVVDDNRKAKLTWILFFQQLLAGSQGTKFAPDIQNLGSTGVPTLGGVYYENQGFVDFYVTIIPATDTTSTAGTTYIQLPFKVTNDTVCFAINGNASSSGGIVAGTNRAYLPAWSGLTTPISITGRVRTE